MAQTWSTASEDDLEKVTFCLAQTQRKVTKSGLQLDLWLKQDLEKHWAKLLGSIYETSRLCSPTPGKIKKAEDVID